MQAKKGEADGPMYELTPFEFAYYGVCREKKGGHGVRWTA
jgi:hypothetical protein